MPRLSRRSLLAALATTAGCAATPGQPAPANGAPSETDTHSFPPPPPTSAAPQSPTPLPTDTDWPQFGHTPDRGGRLDGTAYLHDADGVVHAVEVAGEAAA